MSFRVLALSIAVVSMAACAKKSSDSAGSPAGPGSEIHNFASVDEARSDLASVQTLANGDFKVKSIRVTRLELEDIAKGSKSTLIHTFVRPGEPSKGDPVSVRADWTKVDKNYSAVVHQQVPFQVTVRSGGLEYTNTTYHGVRIDSNNKSWQWVSSTSTSGRELSQALRANAVRPQSAVVTKVIVENPSAGITMKTAIRPIDANSFVLIHHEVLEGVAEVYTEVTYVR